MERNTTVAAGLVALAILFSIAESVAFSDRLEPAERSGLSLPRAGVLSARADIGGIYVSNVEGPSGGATGVLEGTLVWNFRLFRGVGLFGKHDVSRMRWDDISLLTFGHEVGARFLFGPFFAFEAAYLGHEIEYEWVDGNVWSAGGLNDHGAEVGMWARLKPHPRFWLEGHAFGRRFLEPKSESTFHYVDQIVYAFGLRATIMVFDGQFAQTEIETLRVYRRGPRRAGVEETTWNTAGTFLWRSSITPRFGIEAGVFASTNWFCGIAPMLEYKRSMIDEPAVKFFAGFYFFI